MKSLSLALAALGLALSLPVAHANERPYEVESCEYQWDSFFSAKRLTVYTNGWTVNLCFLADSNDDFYLYRCQGVAFTQPGAAATGAVYERSSKRVALKLRDGNTLECLPGRGN